MYLQLCTATTRTHGMEWRTRDGNMAWIYSAGARVYNKRCTYIILMYVHMHICIYIYIYVLSEASTHLKWRLLGVHQCA